MSGIIHASVAVAAAADSSFVDSLGVNTHIDFNWTSYNNLADVANALAYLGIQNVRDAIDNPTDLAKFAALNQDLGIKFDFFIAPGDVGMPWQLQQIESDPAIVRFVEGPNESDIFPQTYNGLTGLAATVAEQQVLYSSVKATMPGTAVIAPSFGQLSSYAQVGDLVADADYGNAHIYFGTGNPPADQGWIQTLLGDAAEVAPGKPVITTETGYYTSSDPTDPNGVDPVVQAKYLLDDVMDQFSAGVSMDYLYELADEQSDPNNTNPELHFGLFNSNWTPKPAAVAIANLMRLLHDPGVAGFVPGSLSYSLTGMPATGNSLLLEKSDGTYVLAVWNDIALAGPQAVDPAPAPVTLTFAGQQKLVEVYDPLTGTSAVQSARNANQITLSLLDHPILVEIGPHAGVVSASPASLHVRPLLSPAAPTGVTLSLPSGVTAAPGQTVAVTGVKITDPWAAATLGGMTLNLSASDGTLRLTDDGGNPVAGSGTSAITLNGSLFQLDTDLANLTYSAGAAGTGGIVVDVWDPAGIEATQTIPVSVSGAAAEPANRGGTGTAAPATIGDPPDLTILTGAAVSGTGAEHSPAFLGGSAGLPGAPDQSTLTGSATASGDVNAAADPPSGDDTLDPRAFWSTGQFATATPRDFPPGMLLGGYTAAAPMAWRQRFGAAQLFTATSHTALAMPVRLASDGVT